MVGYILRKRKHNLASSMKFSLMWKQLSQQGFSENLDGLPVITFRTIWTYMVACVDAKKQLSTAKPMVKGFNFYKSGHVLNVKSCTKENRTYVKSLVDILQIINKRKNGINGKSNNKQANGRWHFADF